MTAVVPSTGGGVASVLGYPVALDRFYDPTSHSWVIVLPDGQVRIGVDAVGVKMNGTLAALSLGAPGESVGRGREIGQVEAAKFVGPLTSPVSGLLRRVNAAVVADPGLLDRDPYGEGWLIEVTPSDWPAESAELLTGAQRIVAHFTRVVEEYRARGVLAE